MNAEQSALFQGNDQKRCVLRDGQWERIKDSPPRCEGHVGVKARANRMFIEAVLYRYRAGISWRDLPVRFGDFRAVHPRLSHWSWTGVWQRIFDALAQDADNEYCMIDSTIVKAQQPRAGAKKGA